MVNFVDGTDDGSRSSETLLTYRRSVSLRNSIRHFLRDLRDCLRLVTFLVVLVLLGQLGDQRVDIGNCDRTTRKIGRNRSSYFFVERQEQEYLFGKATPRR